MKMMMTEFYRRNEKCDTHMYGVRFNGTVYACISHNMLAKLDTASRGAGKSLRFKPNKAEKLELVGNGFPVCSEEHFEEVVKMLTPKYGKNNGNAFEYVMAEYYGQTWEKDFLGWWEGADMVVDGIAYQLKFEKATFTNERQIARLKEEEGLR